MNDHTTQLILVISRRKIEILLMVHELLHVELHGIFKEGIDLELIPVHVMAKSLQLYN